MMSVAFPHCCFLRRQSSGIYFATVQSCVLRLCGLCNVFRHFKPEVYKNKENKKNEQKKNRLALRVLYQSGGDATSRFCTCQNQRSFTVNSCCILKYIALSFPEKYRPKKSYLECLRLFKPKFVGQKQKKTQIV